MCKLWQAVFLLPLAVGLAYSPELEDFECSIMAILSGQRQESDECNLRSILHQRVVSEENEFVKKSLPWPRLQKKVHFGLRSCSGPGAVCRVNGKRTCICPQSYVCDPVEQTDLFACVKLTYFVHQE